MCSRLAFSKNFVQGTSDLWRKSGHHFVRAYQVGSARAPKLSVASTFWKPNIIAGSATFVLIDAKMTQDIIFASSVNFSIFVLEVLRFS